MGDVVSHSPLPMLPDLVRAVEEGVTVDMGGKLSKSGSAMHVP